MKKNKDYMRCVIALCVLSLFFMKSGNKDENEFRTSITYEVASFFRGIFEKEPEDNTDFDYENDIISYSDSNYFNLLINMYYNAAAIRTNIYNEHILDLNALNLIINYKGVNYIGIQYNGNIDLLWDWNQDDNMDKIIDAGITAKDFAHRIYADNIFEDVYPNKEMLSSQSDTYFKYVYSNPAFRSTRLDESGEFYHVIFYSLTKDKSAINFAKDTDCYVPSDLEVKIAENGIIYGEGIVTRERCEELLAEYLKTWLRIFEPEKAKELKLEDFLDGPQVNL